MKPCTLRKKLIPTTARGGVMFFCSVGLWLNRDPIGLKSFSAHGPLPIRRWPASIKVQDRACYQVTHEIRTTARGLEV